MSTPEERIEAFLVQWRAVWKMKTDIHFAHGLGDESAGLYATDLAAVLDGLKAARAALAEAQRTIRAWGDAREQPEEDVTCSECGPETPHSQHRRCALCDGIRAVHKLPLYKHPFMEV